MKNAWNAWNAWLAKPNLTNWTYPHCNVKITPGCTCDYNLWQQPSSRVAGVTSKMLFLDQKYLYWKTVTKLVPSVYQYWYQYWRVLCTGTSTGTSRYRYLTTGTTTSGTTGRSKFSTIVLVLNLVILVDYRHAAIVQPRPSRYRYYQYQHLLSFKILNPLVPVPVPYCTTCTSTCSTGTKSVGSSTVPNVVLWPKFRVRSWSCGHMLGVVLIPKPRYSCDYLCLTT